MEEEPVCIDDIVDYNTDICLNLLEIIEADLGKYGLDEGKKVWNITYDAYKGKCLPPGYLDVYAFSVANEKLRDFYTRVKRGLDYLDEQY